MLVNAGRGSKPTQDVAGGGFLVVRKWGGACWRWVRKEKGSIRAPGWDGGEERL